MIMSAPARLMDVRISSVTRCSSIQPLAAAALSMAWFRPDLFRRVMAYSGTFVDQQDDDAPEEAKFPLGWLLLMG